MKALTVYGDGKRREFTYSDTLYLLLSPAWEQRDVNSDQNPSQLEKLLHSSNVGIATLTQSHLSNHNP